MSLAYWPWLDAAFGDLDSGRAFSGPIGLKNPGRQLLPGRSSVAIALAAQKATQQRKTGRLPPGLTPPPMRPQGRLPPGMQPTPQAQQRRTGRLPPGLTPTPPPMRPQGRLPPGKAPPPMRPQGRAPAFQPAQPQPRPYTPNQAQPRAQGRLPPGFAGALGEMPPWAAANGAAWVCQTPQPLYAPTYYNTRPERIYWPDGTPAESRIWLPALDMSQWFDPVRYVNESMRGTQHENRIQNYYKDRAISAAGNFGWFPSGAAEQVFGSRAWEYIIDPQVAGNGIQPGNINAPRFAGFQPQDLVNAGRAWLEPLPGGLTRERFLASFDWSQYSPGVNAPIWLFLNVFPSVFTTWQKVPAHIYRYDLQPGDPEDLPPLAWLCLDFLDAIHTGAHGFPVLVKLDAQGYPILDRQALADWLRTPQGAPWERLIQDPIGNSMLAMIDDINTPMPEVRPDPGYDVPGRFAPAQPLDQAEDPLAAGDPLADETTLTADGFQASGGYDSGGGGYDTGGGGYDTGGYDTGGEFIPDETYEEEIGEYDLADEEEIAAMLDEDDLGEDDLAALLNSGDDGEEELEEELGAEDLAALLNAQAPGEDE